MDADQTAEAYWENEPEDLRGRSVKLEPINTSGDVIVRFNSPDYENTVLLIDLCQAAEIGEWLRDNGYVEREGM